MRRLSIGEAKRKPRLRPYKRPTLSRFQFALLRQVIQPGADVCTNDADLIMRYEAALIAAGWSPAQAKAETRRVGSTRTNGGIDGK